MSFVELKIADADYGMYSQFGNDAVEAVVRRAQVLQLDWPATYAELIDLANRFPHDFGEATDTAVRECVYDALGFTSSFYI